MARLEDIPEPTRTAVANIPCPVFDTTPFVAGPKLSERRVAIVSSANRPQVDMTATTSRPDTTSGVVAVTCERSR